MFKAKQIGLDNNKLGLLRLALPLILGNLAQMTLGIIDSMMVGQISYKHLAASSLVNNYIALPYVCCIGLTTVLSPLISYALQQNDKTECGKILFNGIIVNLTLTGALAIVVFLSSNLIFHLGQEQEVAKLGKPFLFWMNWSIIPMIFFLTMKQFCDGLQEPKIPMILSFLSIPINTILNYILIYGNFGFPRMELEGSGIATFTTRIIIAIVLFFYISQSSNIRKLHIFKNNIDNSKIKKILYMAVPSAWQYTSEAGAFVVLGIIVGWFGAVQQAAHQIALSIASFTFMISMGLSTSGSIKVSEAFGNNDINLARKTGLDTVKLAAAYGLICLLLFLSCNTILPYAFNKDAQVLLLASQLMVYGALFQISDAIQAVGVGILRGMHDIKYPSLITTISYWLCGIPLGYFLAINMHLQAYGVWIGFITCLTIASILLVSRFHILTNSKISLHGI